MSACSNEHRSDAVSNNQYRINYVNVMRKRSCRVSTLSWKMNELNSKIRQVTTENGYWNSCMDGKESNVPAPKKNNVNAPEQEHTKKKKETSKKKQKRKQEWDGKSSRKKCTVFAHMLLNWVQRYRRTLINFIIFYMEYVHDMLRKPCMCNLPQNSQFTPENSIMYWRCFCHGFSMWHRIILPRFHSSTCCRSSCSQYTHYIHTV